MEEGLTDTSEVKRGWSRKERRRRGQAAGVDERTISGRAQRAQQQLQQS